MVEPWRRPPLGLALLLLLALPGCTYLPFAGGPWFGPPNHLNPGNEFRYYPLVLDMDGDGHLDIVATHRLPGHRNSLRIWSGDGTGDFEEWEKSWRSPGYGGVAVADLNGDGHLDVVVASHFRRVETLISDGNRGFRTSVLATEDGWSGAQLADMDGDGALDLVLLGWKEAGVEVWRGDGQGGWVSTESLLEGIGRGIEVVDLDGDGVLNIVASLGNQGIVVLQRRENGEWDRRDMGFPSKTRHHRSMQIVDLNRDGHLDFALNGGFDGRGKPAGPDVYLADGTGGYVHSSKGLKVLINATESIAVGDIDGDGHLDLIAGGSTTGKITELGHGLFLWRGDGRGNWKLDERSGLPSEGLVRPYFSRLRDLDGDGDLDLVITHGSASGDGGRPAGSVSVWLHQ